jgi:homoserine O-acetyltransferase
LFGVDIAWFFADDYRGDASGRAPAWMRSLRPNAEAVFSRPAPSPQIAAGWYRKQQVASIAKAPLGALYPGMVERIAPFCGSAKCSRHNFVFLEGVKAALTADAAWLDGWYEKQPDKGLRAFARVYAGWGFSQPFYRRELWRQLDFSSLDDFLVGFWERRFLRRDANNLLAMLWTWQHNNVGATPGFGASLEKALASIKAKALVMAGQTDLYFTPEDIEYEAALIPAAQYRVIPSVWGHQAGNGLNPADSKFVDDSLRELLAS